MALGDLWLRLYQGLTRQILLLVGRLVQHCCGTFRVWTVSLPKGMAGTKEGSYM